MSAMRRGAGPEPAAARRPGRRPPPRRRRPSPLPALAVGLVGVLALLFAIRALRHSPDAASVAPPIVATATAMSARATPSPEPSPTSSAPMTALAARIAAVTAPLQGTYGVWVEDLPTGAVTGQHMQQQFVAASVIKFFILVALYEQSAKGQIALDDKVTTTAADIQNYGTGSIRYDPVGSTYTYADLASRAAKQSDNTAAYLIEQRLGVDAIQRRVVAWGAADTSIANDRTTPQDAGRLFAAVAERKILPPRSALDLLGLLTNTDFEDRLPALLPPYAVVAHKIGTEANGVMNDVGVVILPTRSYAISVMTAGADPDQAITAEQQISLAVFAYEAALP